MRNCLAEYSADCDAPPRQLSLSLDAQDLLQRVNHIDQVRLVPHHLVDIFVRAGNFVIDVFIMATLNGPRLCG